MFTDNTHPPILLLGRIPVYGWYTSNTCRLKGKGERGKGKEKTFNPYPVGELVEPLTFSPNQIPV
jgi:hypothetical protein